MIQDILTQGNKTIEALDSFTEYSSEAADLVKRFNSGILNVTTKVDKLEQLFNEVSFLLSYCNEHPDCEKLKVSQFVLFHFSNKFF